MPLNSYKNSHQLHFHDIAESHGGLLIWTAATYVHSVGDVRMGKAHQQNALRTGIGWFLRDSDELMSSTNDYYFCLLLYNGRSLKEDMQKCAINICAKRRQPSNHLCPQKTDSFEQS